MSEKAKIVKVERPIDQRETFVSLSKNFSEGNLSVAEKLQVLYALQQTDIEIDKIVSLRGALPEEVEAIESEIAVLKGRIEEAQRVISGYEGGIEAQKETIVDIDAKASKYQEQLNNVANSREYDSLSKELENLDLERKIAEKAINELRYNIGKAKDTILSIEERLSIREDDLSAKRNELKNIVESTSEEEKVLQERREKNASKLDERTLSAYDRIRTSTHNHLAVVGVYEGSCGGCFNAITPQKLIEIASGNRLVICEHCGRILVNPLAQAEE